MGLPVESSEAEKKMGLPVESSEAEKKKQSAVGDLRVVIAQTTNCCEKQHAGPVTSTAIVGAGLRWAIAGGDEQGRILIYKNWKRFSSIHYCGPEYRCGAPVMQIRAGRVDNDRFPLVAACHDSSLRFWNVPVAKRDVLFVGEEPSLMKGHTADLRSVDLNQDFALTGSDDGSARVWDLATQKEVVSMLHPHRVSRVLFTPASTCLATYCVDEIVRVFDVRRSSSRPTLMIQQPPKWVMGGFVINSQGLLATTNSMMASSQDQAVDKAAVGEVRVYDVNRSAKCLMHYKLPKAVSSAQFVMDDRYIVSACADGKLYFLRMSDRLLTRVVVDRSEAKQKVVSLSSVPLRSKQLLAFAYQEQGWGFAKLYEDPVLEAPAVAKEATSVNNIDSLQDNQDYQDSEVE